MPRCILSHGTVLNTVFGGCEMAHQEYQACIEACVRCAQECENCANACLFEPDAKAMAGCIRLDKDCAAICWLTAAFMSRRSEFDTDVCRLCAAVCEACGTECEKHPHDHCQRCAEACRTCAEECRKVAGIA